MTGIGLIIFIAIFSAMWFWQGPERALLVTSVLPPILIVVGVLSSGIDTLAKFASYDSVWMLALIPAVASGLLMSLVGLILIVRTKQTKEPTAGILIATMLGALSALSPFLLNVVKWLLA